VVRVVGPRAGSPRTVGWPGGESPHRTGRRTPGQDAAADGVRDRGPRRRGSTPSTSLTSTSRTGGPGCAPKRRDRGVLADPYNRSCYPDSSPA